MSIPNFAIPLNREDLLTLDTPGQYYVQELVENHNIPRRLSDCSAALSDDGFLFILNYFDPLFSALHQSWDLDTKHILTSHNIILKGISGMVRSLPTMVEEFDSHLREKLLNAAKMYLFLLFEAIRSLEERFNSRTEKEMTVDAKSRRKAVKNFMDFDWDEKRNVSLVKLHEFIHLPLSKLWEPPIADEDFVNLAANCCYKTLEDPQISQVRLQHLKHTTFDILGTLIQKYGHGLSCTVKIVQLLKIYDHLPEILAEAAVKFVLDYQSRNFVREVIREITQTETAFEGSSPKAYSHFLVEIAKLDSEVILPSMVLLLPELENDSYMMRNCILGVIGEVVSGSLTKEQLSEQQKETRDLLLEHLEDHLIDVNASVRGKVLKIWQKLCSDKAIPLARLSLLLEHTVARLEDSSWNVTRNAVQLYHALLQSNPFGDKLEIQKLKEKCHQEEEHLAILEKEINSKAPITRQKQWDEISPKVILVLQHALSSREDELAVPEEALTNSISENITLIFHCLESDKYLEAFYLMRYTEQQSAKSKLRNNEELDWQVDYFHKLLGKIFIKFDENSEDGTRKEKQQVLTAEQKEAQESLLKQRTLTQYYKDCIVFVEQLEKSTKIISNLLFSGQPPVVVDALEFLTAAFQFGLEGALSGVQNMLLLVWSSESSVKDKVASSYRQLYLDIATHAPGRTRAGEIVKNLCHLLKTLDEDQQAALEVLVREWVKNDEMEKECIQVMWERFSMKLPDTSEDDSRAALILLAMVGGAAPTILKTNIPVLISVGLGERGQQDYRLAKETCRALLKLVPETTETVVTSNDEAFRLSEDHEIFQTLCSLLVQGYSSFEDKCYIPMACEAIDVIYQLSEHPDKTCTTLLIKFLEQTKKAAPSEMFDDLMNSEEDKGSHQTVSKQSNIPSEILTRLVFFIGHIAFRQWVHLDRAVYRELKRRNRIRELEAEKKRGDKQKNKTKNDGKKSNLNSSILSRASETPRQRKDKEDAADADIGEINADDADADYINHVCEAEIVTGETILASLRKIVVTVCSNPQKYVDKKLRCTAGLALTKLMVLSSTVCEENLPLVFTMMEKSSEPKIRSNLVYAVGDLANRFPNNIEPWTKHLYERLQDQSSEVRLNTVVVLKHLITNEMVKVRGQISDMALCIVDADERISVMASEFFRDLSKKGNTLYNVLPDIISRLSNPGMNVLEEHFHKILEFLLPLIQKDKQMESLVDKLCQRFRASTTERQWSDVAFCLSLLQYSDRSLRRLTENFQCYSDKLNTPKVYEAFQSIITQALKNNKPDRKILVEELQTKIEDILKKGLGADGGNIEETDDQEESTLEVDGSGQKENRLFNARNKTRKEQGRKKQPVRRRGHKKAQADVSDDDAEQDSSDDSQDSGHLSRRPLNRKRRR